MIHDPVFLAKAVSTAIEEVKNPKKYVPRAEIESVKENIAIYARRLVEKLSESPHNMEEIINRIKNLNSAMKASYLVIGLGISAFFMSYAIPKIQYFITRRRTSDSGFPGVKNLK